jgi:hypothetical protein
VLVGEVGVWLGSRVAETAVKVDGRGVSVAGAVEGMGVSAGEVTTARVAVTCIGVCGGVQPNIAKINPTVRQSSIFFIRFSPELRVGFG